jgi:hypothetical protein
LRFYNDAIVYVDPEKTRWNQVSMLARVGIRMTTTSKTIGSLNGRLIAILRVRAGHHEEVGELRVSGES